MAQHSLPSQRGAHWLLLGATFIIAISGLVYELLAGTLSSYLLGDSVYQFSIVIGLFMSAMGIGAYLSRFIQNRLERAFVLTQIALGLLGGFSAPLLFMAFALVQNYAPFLLLVCLLIGTLVGLEIPLITRILERQEVLKLTISNVLTADYIGALAAAVLFPLVLVPKLGLLNTSLFFGLMNLLVAGGCVWLFRTQLDWRRLSGLLTAGSLSLLLAMLFSQQWVSFFEQRLFKQDIIFAQTTPYQRLVLTRQGEHVRLFINGSLQFNSQDEYRYHESLVHPLMNLLPLRENVLILGGGDGLALREVLKYPDVKRITLVDLDPAMTDLFRNNPLLRRLHGDAFADPRVEIINQDAWKFIETDTRLYEAIVLDLPDPHHTGLSKLYSNSFYHQLAQHLSRSGLLVTQATSPLFAREAFWCIHNTLAATQDALRPGETLYTLPYHVYVPSFGAWGFVLAGHHRPNPAPRWQLPADLRFFSPAHWPAMQTFAPDMAAVDTAINSLQTHALLGYYETGWQRWFP